MREELDDTQRARLRRGLRWLGLFAVGFAAGGAAIGAANTNWTGALVGAYYGFGIPIVVMWMFAKYDEDGFIGLIGLLLCCAWIPVIVWPLTVRSARKILAGDPAWATFAAPTGSPLPAADPVDLPVTAGWYDDPWNTNLERHWDGVGWSERTRPRQQGFL